ncbi:Peptidoglycan deacetylase [Poriferisphaera corsica]|uniref:Peptidoglycan deacetylase n=2 Tax=Poriferisphaera corsica TaxID=2528020 RepID=A0A517YXL6_9BACT|nr:Peptidoglycan deacetylase [Poriferisphaera corsica]
MTIDVEEYFQIEAAHRIVKIEDWDRHESRVEQQMDLLLGLFAEHNIQATLFTLGWIAKKHPLMVRRFTELGHEVACHGNMHQRIHRLSKQTFALDLQTSKSRLEDVTGQPILGYRAPTWSLTQQTAWAADVIANAGFVYDASIFPTKHPQYGIPHAPTTPYTLNTPANKQLTEIPPLVWRITNNRNLPVAGGGYFRQFPLAMMKMGMRQAIKSRRPAVLYFHPWEFDKQQPKLPLGKLGKIRTYRGIRSAYNKLDRICRFGNHISHWQLMRDIAAATTTTTTPHFNFESTT